MQNLLKFNAAILNPRNCLHRSLPRTGILSIRYFLRSSDGIASTPFGHETTAENILHNRYRTDKKSKIY